MGNAMRINIAPKSCCEDVDKALARNQKVSLPRLLQAINEEVVEEPINRLPTPRKAFAETTLCWDEVGILQQHPKGKWVTHENSLTPTNAVDWVVQVREETRQEYRSAFNGCFRWAKGKGIPTKAARAIARRKAIDAAAALLIEADGKLSALSAGLKLDIGPAKDEARALIVSRMLVVGRLHLFIEEMLEALDTTVEDDEPISRWFAGDNRTLDIESGDDQDHEEDLVELMTIHTRSLQAPEWEGDPDESEPGTYSSAFWNDQGPRHDGACDVLFEEMLLKVKKAKQFSQLESLIRQARFLSKARQIHRDGWCYQAPGEYAAKTKERYIRLVNEIRRLRKAGKRAEAHQKLVELRAIRAHKLPAGLTYRQYAEVVRAACVRAAIGKVAQGVDVPPPPREWVTSPRSGGMMETDAVDAWTLQVDSKARAAEVNQWLRSFLPETFQVLFCEDRWGVDAPVIVSEDDPKPDDALGQSPTEHTGDHAETVTGDLCWEPEPEEMLENSQRAEARWGAFDELRMEYAYHPLTQGWGDVERMPPLRSRYRTSWNGRVYLSNEKEFCVPRPCEVRVLRFAS